MKKQLTKRPLVLETTTIRTLTDKQVGTVAGGMAARTSILCVSAILTVCTCP